MFFFLFYRLVIRAIKNLRNEAIMENSLRGQNLNVLEIINFYYRHLRSKRKSIIAIPREESGRETFFTPLSTRKSRIWGFPQGKQEEDASK